MSSVLKPSGAETAGRRVSFWFRLWVAGSLLLGLRRHDFRAPRILVGINYPGQPWVVKWVKFVGWSLHQMWVEIPNGRASVTFDQPISRTPFWLTATNPHANHPWAKTPNAALPAEADTVVIGAGFTGGAAAYHWSKRAPAGRKLVALEMDDPAAGASGRNEGAMVMGRYFGFVRDTVKAHLPVSRPDLDDAGREKLARAFAAAYCRAAYHSAELVAETIKAEGFQCDYHRQGWVMAKDPALLESVREAVALANEYGFGDLSVLSAQEAAARTGMKPRYPAAFSQGCAEFHPAKWVWCLLTAALRSPTVELFTQTKVLEVRDVGEAYEVRTTRGTIRARHVLNATESYTPKLQPRLRPHLTVYQTQVASGLGGPATMTPGVVMSGTKAFWGPTPDGRTLFGSDQTKIPYQNAGQNKPSRFITSFFLGHMMDLFGPYKMRVTHEWSGSIAATADGYPIVGLMDGKGQYIIAGLTGSGSNVSYNAARCVVCRILGTAEQDDYPEEYFGPSRVMDPKGHRWPAAPDEAGPV
jgi:glycine/D-amino acid oxidase-like deaminating enzyme